MSAQSIEYPIKVTIRGFHQKRNLELSKLYQGMIYESTLLTVHALPEFLLKTLESVEISLDTERQDFSICFSFKGNTSLDEWEFTSSASALFRLIPDVNAEKIKEFIIAKMMSDIDARLVQEEERQAGLSGALQQLRSR